MTYDHRSLTRTIRTKIEVDDESGCWIWTGAKDRNGYAEAKVRGKVRVIHRYVYDTLVGGLDPDLTIDHLCTGNRNCVNPEHMEQVSRSENSRRANHRRWVEGYSRKEVT